MIVEIGAWKGFDDLEDHVTLNELFELYDGVCEKRHEFARVIGMAQGADIPSYNELKGQRDKVIRNETDLASIPIGLGYAKFD